MSKTDQEDLAVLGWGRREPQNLKYAELKRQAPAYGIRLAAYCARTVS
jgi:hypothetical protein